MKKLLYLIPFLLIAACKKDDDDGVGVTPIEYADVPNWQTVPMVADMQGGTYDTMYAYTSASGTFIRYKGRPYRIKARTGIIAYPVADSLFSFYVTVFDGSDQPITDCIAASGRYVRNGVVITRPQTLDPTHVAPFDTGRITPYYSR